MKKRSNFFGIDQPLAHTDHRRPVTRREFVSQGFSFGLGAATAGSLSSLLMSTDAHADLSQDILDAIASSNCGTFSADDAKIPFICFDLAGGANIAGSNVLVGGPGGQRDFLSVSGYQKQGLPSNMVPSLDTSDNPQIDDSLGLLFHNDSQLLRGIAGVEDGKALAAAPNINGAVIAVRSENDTGNNPHNPMYLINQAGANGELLGLIGSRSSDSGGNSVAPLRYMNPEQRPTKIDRASDAIGLVDTGDLVGLLSQVDTTAVMESVYRLSNAKMGRVDAYNDLTADALVKDLVRCGYLKAARDVDRLGDASTTLNPELDSDIVGDTGIFSTAEFTANDRRGREFQKTAAIMKLVVEGFAGAGTITMGGYDYHTGDRATGEERDYLAGQCIGACLDFARRKNKPLMVYVFSDGSVFSNGMLDDTAGGRGKGVWTGDNQQTGSAFFLAYNPSGRPAMRTNQIGWMKPSGDVETTSSPVANNVNLLTEAVALNYMAFNGERSQFESTFLSHGLGSSINDLVAFEI